MLQQTKGNRVQISRANEETKEHRHKDLALSGSQEMNAEGEAEGKPESL